MEITSGIAKQSMEMAESRLRSEVGVSMLKKVMDFEKDNMDQLLKSLGVGSQLNIRG